MKYKTNLFLFLMSFFMLTGAMAEGERYIVDVRTLKEFESGHIEHAMHMPYEQIAELIKGKIDDKDAAIVLYCKSGGRAGIAAKTLEELGYSNVKNAGGIDDMRKTYPIELE